MTPPRTNVSNLRTTWVDRPREEWLEDLEDLASGYPFEQRRRDYRPTEPAQACRQTWEEALPTEKPFLGAHFESRLVGWLRLRRDPRTPPGLSHGAWRLDWELIQRNRNDIRRRLFQEVLDRVPEGIVRLSQPAQNRTARTFLRRQPDLFSGGTWTYMARRDLSVDPPETAWPEGTRLVNLEGINFNGLRPDTDWLRDPEWSHHPLGTNTGEPGTAFEGTLARLDREGLRGYGLVREDTLLGLVVAEVPAPFAGKNPSEAVLRRVQVHPGHRRQGWGTHLVNRMTQTLAEGGVRYLELRVHSDNDPALSFFEDRGFAPVSKRMSYYRIPPGVQSDRST